MWRGDTCPRKRPAQAGLFLLSTHKQAMLVESAFRFGRLESLPVRSVGWSWHTGAHSRQIVKQHRTISIGILLLESSAAAIEFVL
jgi:hypothetical protein